MKRVVVSNMFAGMGGGELCLLDHVRHLCAGGVHVQAYLLEDGPLRIELEALKVQVEVQAFAWRGSKLKSAALVARQVARVWSLVRTSRPDVWIAYTFNDFVLAGLATRLAGVPIVYRAQGEVFPPSGRAGHWLGPLIVPFVRFVRPRIVCTTRRETKAMVAAGLPRDCVTHVYLGVSSEKFGLDEIKSTNDPPIVGIFGRLVRWKGQDTFLRAIGLLRSRGIRCVGWVVGSPAFGDGDAYLRELHETCIELGIQDRVQFLGFRRDTPQLMARCDVVCHCSEFEPFGMVVVEAMMLGRPVIAADVSGPREIVVDGESGVLVQPGDASKLADALAQLLGDPGARLQLSVGARDRALASFERGRSFQLLDAECRAAISARSS